MRLESLERRMLLASDSFHNFLSPHDVNDDGKVSTVDALTVINRLSREDSHRSSDFEDVNDDGSISARDALNVINALARTASKSDAVDEAIAQLRQSDGARVKFEYEVEGSKSKLEIKIQNAAANTEYPVLIDGVMIGTIISDGRGRGKLEFGSDSDGRPMPENLPAINDSTLAEVVGIGQVPFHISSSSGSDDNSSSGSSSSGSSSSGEDSNSSSESNSTDGASFELKAYLSGDPAIDGIAKYEQTSTDLEFKVELRDAPAGATYVVLIDDVPVGELHTDDRGRGVLAFERGDNSKPFPAEFPVIQPGTVIKVGVALAGTFSPDSNS